MSEDIINAAQCFGLYESETGSIVGICAVIHNPNPNNPKIKRCHRLVIHPDYQGIGLGKKLLNAVSDYWMSLGFDFTIVTSAKNLIHGLARDSKWVMTGYGVSSSSAKGYIKGTNHGKYNKSCCRKVKVARFKRSKRKKD